MPASDTFLSGPKPAKAVSHQTKPIIGIHEDQRYRPGGDVNELLSGPCHHATDTFSHSLRLH
eukprot:4286975-Lingulodinium_polyedra.AAC.1